MPELEPHYPCPVCLGVKMAKVRLGSEPKLVIDHCKRCGGTWFDEGEVPKLRQIDEKKVRQKIELDARERAMRCQSCDAMIDRNVAKCPACGWKNVIDCPICQRPMQHVLYQGKLHLDACKHCRGVWFDRIELVELWNLSAKIPPVPGSRKALSAGPVVAGPEVFDAFDMIILADLVSDAAVGDALAGAGHVGADVLAHGGGFLADSLSNAPELAGAAVEGSAELASGMFEAIAEVIGAVFDALG